MSKRGSMKIYNKTGTKDKSSGTVSRDTVAGS